MQFLKQNKISKEWKTMKVIFDFENGMELTLKPENISLAENPGKGVALITKTNEQVLGLLFFPNTVLATPAEIKARADAAAAAVQAAANQAAAAQAAANATPAAPVLPAAPADPQSAAA
jgi:hypothetical protein